MQKNAVQLRKERDARGDKSAYTMNQSWLPIPLNEIEGERIDYLSNFDVQKDNGTWEKVLRWCQGTVTEVIKNVKKPLVMVEWDGMPDVEGFEESYKSKVELVESKWNKDYNGAWRKDLDIEIGD